MAAPWHRAYPRSARRSACTWPSPDLHARLLHLNDETAHARRPSRKPPRHPPFRPVLLDPDARRVQRQRVQERAGDPGQFRHRRLESGPDQPVREPGRRPVHPAVLRVLGDRRPAGREVRESAADPDHQIRRDRHHGARRGRPVSRPGAVPARRAVPDGRAVSTVRPGEVFDPAAGLASRRVDQRQRLGGSGHLPGDPARHHARRLADRAQLRRAPASAL